MTRNQILAEEHHRRARSIGGTDNSYNKSFVEEKLHECWHILFGNMNAFQIANRLNQMNAYKPKDFKIVCKFINGTQVKGQGGNNSKDIATVGYAWETLFRGMDFLLIIEYINNVWLDPSYHFYVILEN